MIRTGVSRDSHAMSRFEVDPWCWSVPQVRYSPCAWLVWLASEQMWIIAPMRCSTRVRVPRAAHLAASEVLADGVADGLQQDAAGVHLPQRPDGGHVLLDDVRRRGAYAASVMTDLAGIRISRVRTLVPIQRRYAGRRCHYQDRPSWSLRFSSNACWHAVSFLKCSGKHNVDSCMK